MLRVIIGILYILHGLVHLLYFGHSRRAFEMKPGMMWPDGTWVFSKFLETDVIRSIAGIACVIAAAGFVAGGIGLLGKMQFWCPVTISAAVFSSILFILLWDGTFYNLDGQGWVGVIINAMVLISIFVLKRPRI